MKIARVVGDENQMEISLDGSLYKGELYEVAEEGEDDDIWDIDGWKYETPAVLDRATLEELARTFLLDRELAFDTLEVASDAF